MRRYTLYKYISRLMACLLAVLLLLPAMPMARAEGESGSCGDGLTWSLSAGILTITGSGAMTNYTEDNMAPWYHLRQEITRLELPAGLTSVGDLAFYGCDKLTAAVIPDSVTRIGQYAFAKCSEMTLLNLGSGLVEIGESAFSECYAVASLRLPESLRILGKNAFYRCESITSVVVPAGVTQIGYAVFAYCLDLVTADVRASVSELPELLFYGCDKLITVTITGNVDTIGDFAFRGCDTLTTVHYGGGSISTGEIQEMINDDIPGFEVSGLVTESDATGTVTSGSSTENPDGSVTQENITVTQGENSSVSTRQETTYTEDPADSSYSVDITVTVEGEEGWEEASGAVEDALKNYSDNVASGTGQAETPEIDVYVKNTDTIDQEFVDNLAGRDVIVTITTQDGSVWKLNGNDLEKQSGSAVYNFGYSLTTGSRELSQKLETETSYILNFHSSAVINAEVLISLNPALAHQTATLLQKNGSEVTRIQTVVVDSQGKAHFYLGSVRDDTDYYIAMNLPSQGDAIIPDEMAPAYGQPIRYDPIEYEITGRTSSWGMTIGQVTWIMIGVLFVVVVTVGFVMYTLNKRRLRMGYIPELDEEDYE